MWKGTGKKKVTERVIQKEWKRRKRTKKKKKESQGEILAQLCVWSKDLQACSGVSVWVRPSWAQRGRGKNKRKRKKSLHNKGNVCLCLCMRTNELAVLLCGISKQTLACLACHGEITTLFANISHSSPKSILITGPSPSENEVSLFILYCHKTLLHLWWCIYIDHKCILQLSNYSARQHYDTIFLSQINISKDCWIHLYDNNT